jgi:YD repeat-containing protein
MRLALIGLSLLAVTPAAAAETLNYTCDANGRLIQVTRAASTGTSIPAVYAYDKADNRINLVPTANARKAVVLPLLGFPAIRLP